MSIAIVACPKCNTLLLNDTVQCHRCRHVLRPDQAGRFRDSALPSDAAVQEDLETCKQCGETYRKGLVRCWSCGTFTRPEIEESYYRLLRGHARSLAMADQHHELREISEDEARNDYLTEEEQFLNLSGRVRSTEMVALDEDFELTGNIRLGEESPTSADGQPDVIMKQGSRSTMTQPESVPSPPASDASAAATMSTEAQNGADQPTAAATPVAAPPADDADSLLNNAKQEETDVLKARKARLGEGFVVFCPMGCKIRVQERHRGKVGRCPKCQATFVVPMARQTSLSGSVPAGKGEAALSAAAAEGATATSKYAQWLPDVHLHRVIPQKLRIKADSLMNDFQEVDVGFDPTGLLLAAYAKGGGMFGGKKTMTKDAARVAVVEHLATKPTLEGLPASFQQELSCDALAQMSMTQPTPHGVESLFGDILVFGAGRIAVRLPKFDDKTTAYLSFSLSQFREFSRLLSTVLGMESFGSGCGIPMQDHYLSTPCHVSKTSVKELQNLTYYQKDPAFKLDVAGYRCKVCSTVISEAARTTLKLGGANAKGIAKAKCPKCAKPMGSQPLYVVPASSTPSPTEVTAAPAAPVEETAATATAAAPA